VVSDPFAGSGTTLIVALKDERQYTGYELKSEHVKSSKKRISNVRKQIRTTT